MIKNFSYNIESDIFIDIDLTHYIEKGLLIENLKDFSQIKSISVDLTLGDSCKKILHNVFEDIKPNLVIDTKKVVKYNDIEWKTDSNGDKYIDIEPLSFLLFNTFEKINLPEQVVFNDTDGNSKTFSLYGHVRGKSSIARLGISTEFGSLIQPGFQGTITLEVFNHNRDKLVRLYQGMPICQVSFYKSSVPDENYKTDQNSKYMNQIEATGSKL